MSNQLLPGYKLRTGSREERETLVKFIKLSYRELFPEQDDFSHLTETVRKYFSLETPLWWVDLFNAAVSPPGQIFPTDSPSKLDQAIACLWMGNAVDQVKGDRHAHIFLLYVMPEHRRRGIGSALMRHAEHWASSRGDHQIGLQVFGTNQAALNLYFQLGYQTKSFWMAKPLDPQPID
ncbi:GNAT family N-acetyltransferase [Lyngbya aestuarii]|uniref:GNAT family N-acetyltransferase n=1 Tax=Lyngbya aestuarii TaxID=118322 RepID=UPI00403E0528